MNVTCLLLAVAIQLECEQFEELGGWKVDSQFVGQMGSSYLLAHGLGHPVADARTSFECPESGSYCVCLRTMDWSSRWSDETAAGRYEVWIDGKPVGTANGRPWGGDAESGWHWQVGTRVDLAKGRHLLALRDLTGFDGRCDAVCLMTDGEPSRSSVTNSVAESDYDLVVAGGGIAGISASIAAARLGLRVALVQDRPVLGGNNSSEVRVHLGAYQNLPPYPRLGDVLAEYGPRAGGNARPAAQYEDERKLKAVRAEKNIALFLSTRVDGVSCEANGGRIEAVSARNVISGSRFRFRAPLFADCTGDGTVGFLSHADFRQGREARSEFGESLAPETADRMTMGASVQWYAVTNSCATGFPREPWMLPFSDRTARVGMRGDWDWETGLGRDQIAEAERIRDYGLLVAYSNWSYLKNGHAEKDRFRNADLEWVAYVAGKRESRRLLGDFILTEKHLDERDVQDDGTCVTTWTIDQHYPWPREVTGFCGEPFRAESRNKLIYPYPIPYRCFYSRNVPNLFMAGRDISVTHVALGTTRVMRTHGMMGEVVGMAASICKKHGCDPRGVYTDHLDELRALMTKGVGLGKPQPPQDYNCGGCKFRKPTDNPNYKGGK